MEIVENLVLLYKYSNLMLLIQKVFLIQVAQIGKIVQDYHGMIIKADREMGKIQLGKITIIVNSQFLGITVQEI